VEHFFIIDPFELDESIEVIQECLTLPGVKVVLARQECAIQAQRRKLKAGKTKVVPENCTLCKQCINVTPVLCYGCGLCAQVCNFEAIESERVR
jgi:indolepyruvate ferredoxin oxidoreductase alpha subunit